MKHKKFVKQLMGMGYQRNMAELKAAIVRASGQSYEQYMQREKQHAALYNAAAEYKKALLRPMAAFSSSMALALERFHQAVANIKWPNVDVVSLFASVDEVHLWPKENPHLDGLRADVVLVDEWAGLPSDKLHEQAVQACAGGGGND